MFNKCLIFNKLICHVMIYKICPIGSDDQLKANLSVIKLE